MKSLNHDTRQFRRHDSDDKKTADDKYAHALMLFAIVTAKRHKKRTNLLVTNLLVVHLLTAQRISACNCTYQLRGSDITSLSCKQTVGQSQLGILGSWPIFSSRIERVLLGQ